MSIYLSPGEWAGMLDVLNERVEYLRELDRKGGLDADTYEPGELRERADDYDRIAGKIREHLLAGAPPGVQEGTLRRLAARVAITRHSELHDRSRLSDDSHDTINTAADVLDEAGVPLPDPGDPETARTAWL